MSNIPQIGQTVWVVSRHRYEAKKVREIATNEGLQYVASEHRDNCYFRFGAGRGAEWIKHSDVSLTEEAAKLKFATVLRLSAASLRKQADEAEAEAKRLESEAVS